MMAVRQALLMMIDAIERLGQREGWYSGTRTAIKRKSGGSDIER